MSSHHSPPNTPPSDGVTQFHLDQQQQRSAVFPNSIAMEEISNQLHDMCMDESNNGNNNNDTIIEPCINLDSQHSDSNTFDCFMDSCEDYIKHRFNVQLELSDSSSLKTDDIDDDVAQIENFSDREESSNILVVTNVDSRLFINRELQQQFESLFNVYDPNITFRYLRSFRRIRLDFSSPEQAEAARLNYNNFTVCSASKCYAVRMIKSNQGSCSSKYLLPPKPTRQFLISPPASPPVGWEPVTENSPCIDVQLISAIANLVPGKFSIHAQEGSFPKTTEKQCS